MTRYNATARYPNTIGECLALLSRITTTLADYHNVRARADGPDRARLLKLARARVRRLECLCAGLVTVSAE